MERFILKFEKKFQKEEFSLENFRFLSEIKEIGTLSKMVTIYGKKKKLSF